MTTIANAKHGSFLMLPYMIIACPKSLDGGNSFFSLARPLETSDDYFSGQEHIYAHDIYGVIITNSK